MVVPIPTCPALFTINLVAVEEPIAKAGPVMPFGLTDNWAHGDVVPMPTFPLASIMKGELSGDVASSTTNDGPLPVLVTESFAHGVVVPTPILPVVVKFPLLVVVALPPTQRLFEMERLVVLALTKVETPETESVPVAVMLAAERLPLTSPLPWTERSCEGDVVPMPTEPPVNHEELLRERVRLPSEEERAVSCR